MVTLGLLARAEVLMQPGRLHGIQNWYLIGVCCLLFLVGFEGDKIPIFDLLWDAAHTFARIPVAALLAHGATSGGPALEANRRDAHWGLIAFLAHGGKMAGRTAATHSPEPFSNTVLMALTILLVAVSAVVRAVRKLLTDAERALA